MPNKNSNALDVIINKITLLIDSKLANFNVDKTFKSTIWEKNEDGTYKISYLNQTYDVKNSLGADLNVGQSVWVKIPNGKLRNMHICGIVSGTIAYSGGSGGGISSETDPTVPKHVKRIKETDIQSWNTIGDKLDKTGDASNVVNTLEKSSTRINLSNGEKLSVSLGKIAKWFSDLKDIAFTGSYEDLTDKPEIPSVGNGTITFKQNNVVKGTFTTNQSENTTIELTDTDINTHYTTGLKVGNSASSTTNQKAANGNVCFNILDDSVVRDSHKIIGTGSATVTSNENGDISINATDTNTWRGIEDNLTSTSSTDSLSAKQGNILKGLIDNLDKNKLTTTSWINVTKPGSWSRVCKLSGYQNGLLNIAFHQFNQVGFYQYFVGVGYGTGFIAQVNTAAHPYNYEIQLRLTRDNYTEYYLEVYNEWDYASSGNIPIKVSYCSFMCKLDDNIEIYKEYTPIDGSSTFVTDLTSKYDGIVANKFYGENIGNASSASKLNTARTIGISGGATGTPMSFDGSKNITIPITSVDVMYLNKQSNDVLILNGNF